MRKKRKERRAAAALAPLRASMDRLNERLLGLVERRARLAGKIAKTKARSGISVRDSRREAAMLRHVLAAAGADLEKPDLELIFQAVFRACRRSAVRQVARSRSR